MEIEEQYEEIETKLVTTVWCLLPGIATCLLYEKNVGRFFFKHHSAKGKEAIEHVIFYHHLLLFVGVHIPAKVTFYI